MVEKDEDLIEEGNNLLLKEWENTRNLLLESINGAIEKGKTDPDTLYIMRELLDAGVVRPRKKTLEEYLEEQEKLYNLKG